MEQSKIEIIKKDAILEIKFKPEFYQRLVIVLQSIIKDKTPQELEKAAKEIEAKQITEEWILNYETMLYIVKGSEEYAQRNNLTETLSLEEFEKEQQKSLPSEDESQ